MSLIASSQKAKRKVNPHKTKSTKTNPWRRLTYNTKDGIIFIQFTYMIWVIIQYIPKLWERCESFGLYKCAFNIKKYKLFISLLLGLLLQNWSKKGSIKERSAFWLQRNELWLKENKHVNPFFFSDFDYDLLCSKNTYLVVHCFIKKWNFGIVLKLFKKQKENHPK